MPRTKDVEIAIKKARKTRQDKTIEDRLTACSRQEKQEIIYIGELVEKTLKGEFGAVLKALTAGRVSQELQNAKSSGIPSDRILGRCEMAENLWNDLEQFVLDKDKLLQPLEREQALKEEFSYTT